MKVYLWKKFFRRIKIKKLHRSGPRGDPGYIQPDWRSESASKVLVERTAHGAGNLGPVSSNVLWTNRPSAAREITRDALFGPIGHGPHHTGHGLQTTPHHTDYLAVDLLQTAISLLRLHAPLFVQRRFGVGKQCSPLLQGHLLSWSCLTRISTCASYVSFHVVR
jgi:hypothetical protein